MKRRVASLGIVVLLASLCGLFGCSGQEESKVKSAVPGGPAPGTTVPSTNPNKKGLEMPGP